MYLRNGARGYSREHIPNNDSQQSQQKTNSAYRRRKPQRMLHECLDPELNGLDYQLQQRRQHQFPLPELSLRQDQQQKRLSVQKRRSPQRQAQKHQHQGQNQRYHIPKQQQIQQQHQKQQEQDQAQLCDIGPNVDMWIRNVEFRAGTKSTELETAADGLGLEGTSNTLGLASPEDVLANSDGIGFGSNSEGLRLQADAENVGLESHSEGLTLGVPDEFRKDIKGGLVCDDNFPFRGGKVCNSRRRKPQYAKGIPLSVFLKDSKKQHTYFKANKKANKEFDFDGVASDKSRFCKQLHDEKSGVPLCNAFDSCSLFQVRSTSLNNIKNNRQNKTRITVCTKSTLDIKNNSEITARRNKVDYACDEENFISRSSKQTFKDKDKRDTRQIISSAVTPKQTSSHKAELLHGVDMSCCSASGMHLSSFRLPGKRRIMPKKELEGQAKILMQERKLKREILDQIGYIHNIHVDADAQTHHGTDIPLLENAQQEEQKQQLQKERKRQLQEKKTPQQQLQQEEAMPQTIIDWGAGFSTSNASIELSELDNLLQKFACLRSKVCGAWKSESARDACTHAKEQRVYDDENLRTVPVSESISSSPIQTNLRLFQWLCCKVKGKSFSEFVLAKLRATKGDAHKASAKRFVCGLGECVRAVRKFAPNNVLVQLRWTLDKMHEQINSCEMKGEDLKELLPRLLAQASGIQKQKEKHHEQQHQLQQFWQKKEEGEMSLMKGLVQVMQADSAEYADIRINKKPKLLALAADIEPTITPGGVTDMVRELLILSEAAQIPVVVVRSKRFLKACVCKGTPQSAVCILDASGAEEMYKNVLEILHKQTHECGLPIHILIGNNEPVIQLNVK